jgi:FMN-dependent NADH-azoreductase
MKLLHLDTSILGSNSVSRALSAEIVAREVALHPGLEVTYRDLVEDKALHLSGAHLAVFQGGQADAVLGTDVAKGAAYMDELFAADIVVIGLPMYNFSIPSQLKAWIDRVTVAGKTFRYGANGTPEGLVTGKTVIIASARGGVYSAGSPAAPFEHQESYLIALLGFLGMRDVTVVRAEGLAQGPEIREKAIAQARQEIAALAA